MRIRSTRWRGLMSALDPLLSSGAIFLIQAAVLLTASKSDFATFSLAYSYVVMGEVVLSALFGAPLITILGRRHDETEVDGTVVGFLRLQLMLAFLLATVGVVIAAIIGIPAAIAMIAGLGFFVLSFRDALRSALVARLQMDETVKIAGVFFTACLVQLPLAFLIAGQIDAFIGLSAMALAALLAVASKLFTMLRQSATVPRELMISLWGMASWSLPGAAVIWLQNSFYLTIVALSLSLAAVGEISASRMAIMPVLIVSSGLMRLWQVRAAAMLREERDDNATRRSFSIAMFVLGAGSVGAAAIFALSDYVPVSWLPEAYPNVVVLVGGWVLFAAANIARTAYSSVFQAMGRYREIFYFNLATLPPILAGVALAPSYFGLLGAILPMALGELALLALLAWRVRG